MCTTREIEEKTSRLNKQRKEVMDKYARRGYFASWCDSCGGTTLHCPECQTHCCSGSEGCPTCKVVSQEDKKFWKEISPIENAMCDL
ncbi:MAG: hypothetical protein ACR2M6_02830 [Vampirovibrionia bacterium]